MHDQEQPDHTSGGVPHAYRLALYWRWTRDLPKPLRGGFLTVLYSLASAANTSGALRMRNGKPIRIQSIAAGACSDLKDVRRWLAAATAAGIVGTEKPPRRGTPTVYVLLITPSPDWAAAVASLEATRRARPKKDAAPWADEPDQELGGPAPQVEEPSWGDRPPNSGEDSWGDRPPNHKGGPAPLELGGPAPQRPRVTQVLHQGEAEVVDQPSPGNRPPGVSDPPDADPPPGSWPPTLTLTTQQRRDARAAEVKAKSASNRGQLPLLLPVRDPEHVATVAEVRAAAEGHPEIVLRAIRDLGVRGAVTLYGHRLVHPHLTDEPEPDTRPA